MWNAWNTRASPWSSLGVLWRLKVELLCTHLLDREKFRGFNLNSLKMCLGFNQWIESLWRCKWWRNSVGMALFKMKTYHCWMTHKKQKRPHKTLVHSSHGHFLWLKNHLSSLKENMGVVLEQLCWWAIWSLFCLLVLAKIGWNQGWGKLLSWKKQSQMWRLTNERMPHWTYSTCQSRHENGHVPFVIHSPLRTCSKHSYKNVVAPMILNLKKICSRKTVILS